MEIVAVSYVKWPKERIFRMWRLNGGEALKKGLRENAKHYATREFLIVD